MVCNKCNQVMCQPTKYHVCLPPLTAEEVDRWAVKRIKIVEEAHQTAANSTLVFG